MLVDGYAAYQTATKSGADGPAPATLAFCWAHVRRKFVEALKFEPACAHMLELIGQLEVLAHRLAVRQQQSAPLIEQVKAWALSQKALPDSTFRKALEYMLELWNGLTVFLHNPRVPLDNNPVERQMRDVVLGRKNHYGSKVPARHRGGSPLLLAHRDGQAARGGSGRLPVARGPGRHRESGHRHSSSRLRLTLARPWRAALLDRLPTTGIGELILAPF
ncbi:Mobile element protein [Hyalangium minutum]|uniref:Mobile element protein n=1 Tax=Hyalangium minutum TaxID=394096 RepID=A0A085VS64_9BACT|nr:Mobile element protein [Hyalangium minutum]